MKIIYFTITVLFLSFTSCKKADAANEDTDTIIDTSAVSQDDQEMTDTAVYATDTAVVPTEPSTDKDAKSDVKLPNKISTTEKVIPGEKGKYSLAETKWGLVELNGKPVKAKTGRDYFINFDSKTGTFKAYAGCNRISGNYFMKDEGKLGFTNIISTRMACSDMEDERNFYNNLQKTDNYMIEDGGKMLHFHIGKKAVAKFEAIR
ncbi:META domain-containing protein [Flavobacterium wongokense]|uniref:META domain-containing protein n=1 Tax=Flavobacterium wongokense TaxID=2910674 RepID=UPI001F1751F0|nr:META domain-containing protein [Flavobacterium sp. WG47]MCF6132562.1 META domain-containing protein [Flavobacterium sp. WG47]